MPRPSLLSFPAVKYINLKFIKPYTRQGLCLALGGLLLAGTCSPPRREPHSADLRPVLLRPSVARTLAKAFLPLLIDLYWLRTLNAIGAADSAEKNRTLYAYGRTLTALDPRFYHAYSYIGLNIPFRAGRKGYVNGDLAADLLQRGLRQFPGDMRLHLYLGFTLYFMEGKYKEAAAVFLAGSNLKGAPRFMAPLAARLLSTSGSAREGVLILQELLDASSDEAVRNELSARLRELQVEVLLQAVDTAVQRYEMLHGSKPQDIEALLKSKVYAGPLQDAMGGRIFLDSTGQAYSTSLQRRYEVYE